MELLQKAKDGLLSGLALLVLMLFAGAWIWIGFKLLFFDSSQDNPALSFTDAQVTIAGFLASAVGAGTASVLGIEIQKVRDATARDGVNQSLAAQVSKAAAGSWLLLVGIALYAVVGCFVLVVYFFDSEVAPEMVRAFSFGVLGWLAGAFAAVFQASGS